MGSTFTFTIKLEHIAVSEGEIKDSSSISISVSQEVDLYEFIANEDKLVFKWQPKMSANIMMEVQYVYALEEESLSFDDS